jgi:hypothetical protein
MSMGDFLNRVWYGKPQYSPEERLVNEAKSKNSSLVRQLTAFGGVNGGLMLLDFYGDGALSWSPYIAIVWGALVSIGVVRYWLWMRENKKELEHARRKVELMHKAELGLLERSARTKAMSGNLSPDELYRITEEQGNKAKEVVDGLGAEFIDLSVSIDHNLTDIKKMTDYLGVLEEFLNEEDLTLLTREQEALNKRIAETKDESTRRELESSLSLITQRAQNLKELSVEGDRLRAKIQSFAQTIESIRTEATRVKTEQMKNAGQAMDASDSIGRLQRELTTMKRVQEELDSLNLSDSSIKAQLASLRAKQ